MLREIVTVGDMEISYNKIAMGHGVSCTYRNGRHNYCGYILFSKLHIVSMCGGGGCCFLN